MNKYGSIITECTHLKNVKRRNTDCDRPWIDAFYSITGNAIEDNVYYNEELVYVENGFVNIKLFLGSIVVSIPACHAGDQGSIPCRGRKCFFSQIQFILWWTIKGD